MSNITIRHTYMFTQTDTTGHERSTQHYTTSWQ